MKLNIPLSELISRPGRKTVCKVCEEEITNGREVVKHGVVLLIANRELLDVLLNFQ